MHLRSNSGPINVLVLNSEHPPAPPTSSTPPPSLSLSSDTTGPTSLAQQQTDAHEHRTGDNTLNSNSTATSLVDETMAQTSSAESALSIMELIQNVVEANMLTFPGGVEKDGKEEVPMDEDESPVPSEPKEVGEKTVSSDLVASSMLGGGSDAVMATLQSMVEAMNKEGRRKEEEAMLEETIGTCILIFTIITGRHGSWLLPSQHFYIQISANSFR